MEAQPLQTVPSPHSGKAVGPMKSRDDKTWKMMKVKEEPSSSSSPSINLGLGIGAAVGGSGEVKGQNHVIIKHEEKQQPPVLLWTPDQLKELEQQYLVFKYIVAGLPVPLHLVHPIWKSVATSSEYANGAIYKQYTSFVGFSPLGFDYRTMMDPEPGRCRRTDGKKWRCGRDVVPSQKYCERHVHRGRQRSRKHVEAPKTASPHYTTPPTNNYHLEKSSTYQSSLVPTNLQLRTPISDNNCTSNAAATISTNNHIEKKNNFSPKKESTTTYALTTPIFTPTPTPTPTTIITSASATPILTPTPTPNTIITSASASPTVAIAAAADNRNSSSSNVHNEGNTNSFVKHNTNVNRSNNNVDIVSNVSPVLGFSPKSVIQDCSSSWVGYRSHVVIDPEPMRCRRTDGKKWQCRKDAVPDQKYCVRHMHRGAKRHAGPSQPVVTIAAIDSRFSPTTKNYRTDDHHVNMNINLSIGIPANSQVVIKDEKSTTTSSSETISANSFINEHSSASHTWPPSP